MSDYADSRIRVSKDYVQIRNQFNGVLISDDFQTNANGNYSVTPKTFRLNSGLPTASGKIVVTKMFINMGMSGNPSLSGFGAITALASGIEYYSLGRNTPLSEVTFTTNLEFFTFASNIIQVELQGSNNFVKMKLDFDESHELIYDLDEGDDIRMTFNDNMSAHVDSFTVFVLGYYLDSPIKPI
jgi:hypothetical protein